MTDLRTKTEEESGLTVAQLIHEAYFWTGDLPQTGPQNPTFPDFELVEKYLNRALSLLGREAT